MNRIIGRYVTFSRNPNTCSRNVTGGGRIVTRDARDYLVFVAGGAYNGRGNAYVLVAPSEIVEISD